jgi:Listeria-Bacteroides repeat domain (List_Bact_rpt)
VLGAAYAAHSERSSAPCPALKLPASGSTHHLGRRRSLANFGWFAAASGGIALTSPYTLTGSTTLYAQWTDTLTFNSEGGSAVAAVTGLDGTTVTLPAAPTWAGHSFAGWFLAPSGGTARSSPYTLTGSTTLYAQWTASSQTITFGSLANRLFGAAPFTVSASATSGLAVSFSSLTPSVCLVAGSTVTIVAAGTCTIRASQTGNATYLPASSVTQSFTVGYGVSTLSPPNKSTFQRGSSIPVKFQITGTNGLPIPASLAASLGCSITVTFNGGKPVCATYSPKTNSFEADMMTLKTLTAGKSYLIVVTVVAKDGTRVASSTVTVIAKPDSTDAASNLS